MTATPEQLLRDHLSRAEASLTDLAGNRSMCSIARSGESVPAVKYAEGALSALSELRRNARRAGVLDDPDGFATLTEALRRAWKERAASMAGSGRDWTAYLSGGDDALTVLADDLPAVPGTAGPTTVGNG
ncbi:MAG: hypothetical protein P8Z68_00370 [Kineosporiaceae bacterium]